MENQNGSRFTSIYIRAVKLTQFFFNATNYFNVRLTHVYLSSARPVVSEPKGLTLLLLVGWWGDSSERYGYKKRCFKQQAKHTADADSPAPAARLRQTTLESLPGRRLDNNSDS